MEYTVDYFIQKFEATQDDAWCIGQYVSGERHCAFGHCGETNYGCTEESTALWRIVNRAEIDLVAVNDAPSTRYAQPTAKQRVLAALRDIKAAA